MVKAYTDIEQSRKLAEILPVESADMWWREVSYGFYHIEAEIPNGWYDVPPKGIPCWSLAALLSLMPKLYDENDLNDAGCQPVLCKGYDNNLWHIIYRETIYGTDWYQEPIDAAFDMVCWLKENNKI